MISTILCFYFIIIISIPNIEKMDQLISVSRAEIKLNTPRQSPSITIGDHNEKGFLSTANIDLNKFVKKSKE